MNKSIAENLLIEVLDEYLMELADTCTSKYPSQAYLEWLHGMINGMFIAGRIGGIINREMSHDMQQAIDEWRKMGVRNVA